MDADKNGWVSSASAWISRMGDAGDFSREFVLDQPMLERVKLAEARNGLDVGCGEGRFCRMLRDRDLAMTGIDISPPMIEAAKRRDTQSNYLQADGHNLPFDDKSFDLVVAYLSLIDIDNLDQAISEVARVLRPSGKFLIANLTSFSTSNGTTGWIEGRGDGKEYYPLGPYLKERADWFEWGGMRIQNWHRPLSQYMSTLLENGLVLTHFDEPRPSGGPAERLERYEVNTYLMIMEWQKPKI